MSWCGLNPIEGGQQYNSNQQLSEAIIESTKGMQAENIPWIYSFN